jgi:hypothetical protein
MIEGMVTIFYFCENVITALKLTPLLLIPAKMNTTLRTSLSIVIVLLIMRKDHTDACCFPSQFEGQLNILMPKENKAGSYKEVFSFKT